MGRDLPRNLSSYTKHTQTESVATLCQLAPTEFKEERLLVKVERKLARNAWPRALWFKRGTKCPFN